MIDRKLLKSGDVGLVRGGVDFVSNLDSWGQWGSSKSPEFGHTFIIHDQDTLAETKPPFPHIIPLTEYDSLFDQGKIVILRHKLLTSEGEDKSRAWMEQHVGKEYPYGWESIGLFGLDDLVERGILKSMGDWLKTRPNPTDYEHSPVCSQYVWLALKYGLGFDFAARYKIGAGRITPGDFYSMTDDFDVIQDKKGKVPDIVGH